MNKINKYFLMGTVALSGMVGFSACSSDDASDDNGKTPAAENGVVKTQFALNVPYSNNGTRMNNQITQQDQIFRGMQNMRILAYNGTPAGKAFGYISLGKDDDAFEADSQRRIYRDVTVPVGTKNFVFYGSAKGNETVGDDFNKLFEYGCLKEDGFNKEDTKLEDIHFDLKSVTSNDSYVNSAKMVGDILNNFINADVTYTPDGQVDAVTGKKWWELTASETDAQKKHAYNLYVKFTSDATGLKSGSWNTVLAALEGLKKSIGTAPTATAKTWLQGFANNCDAAIAALKVADSETSVGKQKFPSNLHLPDGVAVISYNSADHKFEYKNPAVMGTGNQIDWTKISYPAALNYFVNTTVKANNNTIDGLTGWPTYSDWLKSDWNTSTIDGWGDEVLATTRSIGLKDAVQYGVANLQSSIVAGNSDLKDKDGTVIGIAESGNYYFKWTGILIGGQPESVRWNYVSSAAATTFANTIYDNKLSEVYDKTAAGDSYEATATPSPIYLKSTEVSRVNNTLVLDNKSADNNEAETVFVTLEFENNSGKEFRGVDGMVPVGGKFYLVGKLTPKKGDNDNTQKDNSTDASHIFVQDYTTKAKFIINGLGNAYNNIPDLRSSEIALGLAVDLVWKTGMEFEVPIN